MLMPDQQWFLNKKDFYEILVKVLKAQNNRIWRERMCRHPCTTIKHFYSMTSDQQEKM